MDSDHQWTLREEEGHVTYRQKLGQGGYGEVHEVTQIVCIFANTCKSSTTISLNGYSHLFDEMRILTAELQGN